MTAEERTAQIEDALKEAAAFLLLLNGALRDQDMHHTALIARNAGEGYIDLLNRTLD